MKNILLLLITLTLVYAITAAENAPQYAFYKVNINKMGHKKLEQVKKSLPKNTWFLELADKLLVHGPQEPLYETLYTNLNLDFSLAASNIKASNEDIIILRHIHQKDVTKLRNVLVLMETAVGYSVLYTKGNQELKKSEKFLAFTPNMVLATLSENMIPLEIPLGNQKNTQTMVDMVNARNWRIVIEKLAGWNRFSYGSQIREALSWVENELKKLPVTISRESFRAGGRNIENLIADFGGSSNDKDYYIIGAHLDSISQGWGNERVAPGAEDNGSSSAGLLIMARILTKFNPKKRIRFIWFTGEEQGLHGSTANANNLVRRGEKDNMKFMLNMDMIGFSRNPNTVRVLLETDRKYEARVNTFRAAAARYSDMGVTVSWRPSGSDHVPYLRRGMEALLVIDADWDKYPHYHRTTDLPRYLVDKMAIEILKMNVGYIGGLLF